jgi:hypothetical protein
MNRGVSGLFRSALLEQFQSARIVTVEITTKSNLFDLLESFRILELAFCAFKISDLIIRLLLKLVLHSNCIIALPGNSTCAQHRGILQSTPDAEDN